MAKLFIKQLFGKTEVQEFCKKLRKQNKETSFFNKTGLLN